MKGWGLAVLMVALYVWAWNNVPIVQEEWNRQWNEMLREVGRPTPEPIRSGPSAFVVHVHNGGAFGVSGSCSISDARGSSSADISFSFATDRDFSFSGDHVSCVAQAGQAIGNGGALSIAVDRDGTAQKRASTSQEYGVVTVAI